MTRSIYVVRSEPDPVKIGIASKPKRRLSQLRTSSAVPLFIEFEAECTGDLRHLETRAHNILEAHRLSGEWFRVDSSAAIAAVVRAAEELGFVLKRAEPVSRKKRGPTPTGWGTPVMCRLRDEQLAALDAYLATLPDTPSRPEAIRRLLGEALQAKGFLGP